MDLIIKDIMEKRIQRDSSADAWRSSWFRRCHSVKEYGIDEKLYHASDWIHGKEVRVFLYA